MASCWISVGSLRQQQNSVSRAKAVEQASVCMHDEEAARIRGKKQRKHGTSGEEEPHTQDVHTGRHRSHSSKTITNSDSQKIKSQMK